MNNPTYAVPTPKLMRLTRKRRKRPQPPPKPTYIHFVMYWVTTIICIMIVPFPFRPMTLTIAALWVSADICGTAIADKLINHWSK